MSNNIPAFPTGTGVTPYNPGMTLRDYFAAKVLQGLIADPSWNGLTTGSVAATAYEVADIMLKARAA